MDHAFLEPRLRHIPANVSLIRFGTKLLVRPNTHFPDRCAISNLPTRSRLKFRFIIQQEPKPSDRVRGGILLAVVAALAVIQLTAGRRLGLPPIVLFLPLLVLRAGLKSVKLALPLRDEIISAMRRDFLRLMTLFALSSAAWRKNRRCCAVSGPKL